MFRALRLCAIAALAQMLSGCAGRTLEGRWVGPMNLPGADECSISLRKGGEFTFHCSGKEPWAGKGRYSFADEELTLEFDSVGREGSPAESSVADLRASVSGPGNSIKLRLDSGAELTWTRTLAD